MTKKKHNYSWVHHKNAFPVSTCRSIIPYSKEKQIPYASKYKLCTKIKCLPCQETGRTGTMQKELPFVDYGLISAFGQGKHTLKLQLLQENVPQWVTLTGHSLPWTHWMLTLTTILSRMLEPSLVYTFSVQCLLMHPCVVYTHLSVTN